MTAAMKGTLYEPQYVDTENYNIDPDGMHLPYTGFYGGVSPDQVNVSRLAFSEMWSTFREALVVIIVLAFFVWAYTGAAHIFAGLLMMTLFMLPFMVFKFVRDYTLYSNLYRVKL